jgi:hypothetical protein
MNKNDPWSLLELPVSGEFTRRKVVEGEIFDVYWVIDNLKQRGILIEIDDEIEPERVKSSLSKLRGVSFSLIKDTKKWLLIRLIEVEYLDIFEKLCLDLADVTFENRKVRQVFPAISNRVAAWKKLLTGSKNTLLSDIEKQGLFGELTFLNDNLKLKEISEVTLVDSWKGPEKSQHDFVLGERAIEVKTVTNISRNNVIISSEDQLFTELDELYLSIYFLVNHSNGDEGISLNTLVDEVLSRLEQSESIGLFESKLLDAKYINISDNNLPRYTVKKVNNYLVCDDFPRVIPAILSAGINSVSYKLDVSYLDKFQVMHALFKE